MDKVTTSVRIRYIGGLYYVYRQTTQNWSTRRSDSVVLTTVANHEGNDSIPSDRLRSKK